MTVSKALLAGVIALTLIPAAAQAATASRGSGLAPAAQSLSVVPAARSLSLSHSVRVGAHSGKSSHVLGLGLLASLLLAAGAVAAAVVIGDAVSNGSSG
jgi:hypothetical protein